jgi:hypothetical protein
MLFSHKGLAPQQVAAFEHAPPNTVQGAVQTPFMQVSEPQQIDSGFNGEQEPPVDVHGPVQTLF